MVEFNDFNFLLTPFLSMKKKLLKINLLAFLLFFIFLTSFHFRFFELQKNANWFFWR